MTTKGEPLSGKIAVVAAGSSPRSPADPDVARKDGRVFASWDLAEKYGVNDADGTRPHFVRWPRENMPEVAALEEGRRRLLRVLGTDAVRDAGVTRQRPSS
jgi:hypothetical protein